MTQRAADNNDQFIWATRGKTWGFRFLRSGGFPDPLNVYETAFSGCESSPEVFRRINDEMLALRFPDPIKRSDVAGRTISHDFVLFGPWASRVSSLEDGIALMWPEVAEFFDDVWDQSEPPTFAG